MKKKLIILLSLSVFALNEASSQTFSSSINPANSVTVFKRDLIGFNAGQGTLEKPFNVCDGCSGAVNPLYQQLIDVNIGSKIMYRVPAGEAGMFYNFWYSGWGNGNNANFKGHSPGWKLNATQRDAIYNAYANYNNLVVSTSYQTKTPDLVNITPTNHKNNLLFPYINIITNNRTESSNANFVVNIMEHYRDYRNTLLGSVAASNGVINPANYFPRQDVFLNTNVIGGISTISQLNASSLSSNTKDIIKQNLDAFSTLIKNGVRVVHVELGNELINPGRYMDNIGCNPITPTYNQFTNYELGGLQTNDKVVWYRMYNGTCSNMNTYTDNSIAAYGNLCKMYIALIKDVVDTLYAKTNNPFYLDIRNNIKFGVPYRGLGSGFQKWGDYLEANKNNIGFNAFVMHNYSPQPEDKLTALNGTLAAKFDTLKNRYVYRFNTLYHKKIPSFIQPKPSVTEIWLTEWEVDGGATYEKQIFNSLLHGMVYMDELMGFIDLNANINLDPSVSTFNRKDVIKLANHHWLWAGANTFEGNLFTLEYNTTASSVRYRTNYYMNKLLLPIFSDNVKVLNQPNGGISENINDLYFRTFTEHVPLNGDCPPYSDVTYIYFNNKANQDYFLNIAANFPVCPHCTISVSRSQIFANKLSASRGKTYYRPSETLYNSGPGYLDSTVQIEENIVVNKSLLTKLPIRHYSAGFYKITVTDLGLTSNPQPCGSSSNGPSINGQIDAVRPQKDLMSIYPNPINDGQFTLEYESVSKTTGSIEVATISGMRITVNNVQIEKGINRFSVNLPNIKPGTYTVKLQTEDVLEIRKIIVQ